MKQGLHCVCDAGLLALADQAVCEALWGSDSDTDGTCTRAQPAAALQPHASTSSTTSQGLPPPPRVGTLPAAHTQALTQRVTRRLYRARAYAHYPDSLYELMLCSLGRAAALPPAMRCQDPALQLAAWSAYEFMGRRESLHGLHHALCATSCLAGLKDAVMDACSSTWYHQEVCATYASRVQAELSAAASDTAQAACTSIIGLQAALADTPLLHDTHSTQRPAAAVAVQAPVCRSWADMLDDEDEVGEQQQAAAVLIAARDMEASTAAAAVTTHTVTAVVSSCTPTAPDPASSSNSSLPRWLQPIAVGESWADIVDEEEEWQ